MKTVAFSEFRANLATLLNEVSASGKPLRVTRRSADDLIVSPAPKEEPKKDQQ